MWKEDICNLYILENIFIDRIMLHEQEMLQHLLPRLAFNTHSWISF